MCVSKGERWMAVFTSVSTSLDYAERLLPGMENAPIACALICT